MRRIGKGWGQRAARGHERDSREVDEEAEATLWQRALLRGMARHEAPTTEGTSPTTRFASLCSAPYDAASLDEAPARLLDVGGMLALLTLWRRWLLANVV